MKKLIYIYIKFIGHNLKFRPVAIFVIVDLQIIFRMYSTRMFMIYQRTKLDVLNSNGLLVITTKPKVKEKISQYSHVTLHSTKELVVTDMNVKPCKPLVYTSRMFYPFHLV